MRGKTQEDRDAQKRQGKARRRQRAETYRSALKLGDEGEETLRVGILHRLLHHAAAVHLHRQVDGLPCDEQGQSLALLGRAVLEELLQHVVAEDVNHKRVGHGQNLLKHELLLGVIANLKALLDEARAVLVLAKGHNVPLHVSQTPRARLAKRAPELVHQGVAARIEAGAVVAIAVAIAVAASSPAVVVPVTVIAPVAVIVAAVVVTVVVTASAVIAAIVVAHVHVAAHVAVVVPAAPPAVHARRGSVRAVLRCVHVGVVVVRRARAASGRVALLESRGLHLVGGDGVRVPCHSPAGVRVVLVRRHAVIYGLAVLIQVHGLLLGHIGRLLLLIAGGGDDTTRAGLGGLLRLRSLLLLLLSGRHCALGVVGTGRRGGHTPRGGGHGHLRQTHFCALLKRVGTNKRNGSTVLVSLLLCDAKRNGG